jgi:hypothetical protein
MVTILSAEVLVFEKSTSGTRRGMWPLSASLSRTLTPPPGLSQHTSDEFPTGYDWPLALAKPLGFRAMPYTVVISQQG